MFFNTDSHARSLTITHTCHSARPTIQVLDIGGSSRFAPLPESVATLPALRSIVLPRGMTGPGSPHSHVLARLQARGGGGADGGAPGLVVLTEG
jgi:hypothetical protein